MSIVQYLLPAIRAELTAITDEFTISSLELRADADIHTLRTHANLSRPLRVGPHTAYPLGWQGRPSGWYQVELTAWGVLQAALVLLIIVSSWPQRAPRELLWRLLLALPLALVLTALDVPLDLLGNLQHMVMRQVDAAAMEPLYAWARFLEGGGNTAIALTFAALTIVMGRQLAEQPLHGNRVRTSKYRPEPVSDHR